MCVVSHYALEEFETLQEDLKLERDLRSEAEKFAHEVKTARFGLLYLIKISFDIVKTLAGMCKLFAVNVFYAFSLCVGV